MTPACTQHHTAAGTVSRLETRAVGESDGNLASGLFAATQVDASPSDGSHTGAKNGRIKSSVSPKAIADYAENVECVDTNPIEDVPERICRSGM
uniref:Uncharacterized protein n=1 Tax=Steinernema glaseri TaxID=37863 RepID=A0A1I7ZUS9_9BILA